MQLDSSLRTSAGITKLQNITPKHSLKVSDVLTSPTVHTPSKQDHNFLLRLPPSQQAEAYVAKVATANINANLIISEARTLDDFDRELTQHNINGVIFEPTLPLGDDLTIDGLYRLMPELKNLEQGSQIQPQKYNNLKMLIQTNFYTYPGVFKYRVPS